MASQRVYGPPGFNMARLLAPLNSTALQHSPEYRQHITRTSPLLFALCYLPHHLRSDETGGVISFSQFHVDVAEAAKRWIRNDFAPAELREAWIAPRGAAKSTWCFLVLPLWSLAFGHQKFIMAFSDSGSQARGHLASMKRELEQNQLLRLDFPELCEPVTARGRKTADNAELYVAKSGVAISAKGIDSSTLGVKIGSQRPTCLLLDDVEPDASNYESSTKAKRLSTIVNAIFPMSLNAVVQWVATVTAQGSLAHDLVKSATNQETTDWITEQNIRARYYSAIITDPDGTERSLWPQRWDLGWLQSIRHTRMYQLNYANQPVAIDGGFWTRDHFRYEPRFPIGAGVLSIDPAVTNKGTSDYTGYAVLAADPSGRRVCVMDAKAIKVAPDQLPTVVEKILRNNSWIRTVILERNNGGMTWEGILRPVLPVGVKVDLYWSSASKPVRYADCLVHYERKQVVHARELPAFEEPAVAYPAAPDDVLDAVTAGVAHFLGEPERQ